MPSATRFNVRIQDMDDYADEQTWEGRHTFNGPVDIYSNLDVKGSIDIYSSTGLYILGLFSSADKAVISSVDDGGGSPIGHDLLVEARYMRFWVENESGTLGREVARFEHAGLMFLGDNAYISIDEIRARNGDGLKLYDDGGNGIFIKDGGNVGIHTTSPGNRLEVKSSGVSTNPFSIENSADTDPIMYVREGSSGDGALMVCDAAGNIDVQLHTATVSFFMGGNVGIGIAVPTAKFHVDQSSTVAAIPVLILDQADIDQPTVKIIGTAESGSADRTLVAASDFTTPGAIVAWEMVYAEDIGNRFTDGKYYRPLYATPTA